MGIIKGIIKDIAGYHKVQISSDDSNHPCTRELLDILGFEETPVRDAKLPKAVFKFVPGAHYTWTSDKYGKTIVAVADYDAQTYGYFFAASKSKEALEQLQNVAKQAVSRYLEYYAKEWARTLNHAQIDRIDFPLIKTQTKKDIADIMPA